ncbi:hypothetical protein [Nocardia wallacei]|uniref:hypothetical protein n=1 Tax=Nocardia wallacei TaxID=480035 RepID=UPI0024554C1C|nr:hypothetical protein [Nocardia wallacei]
MQPSCDHPSPAERQLALAILAHAARRDGLALAASLRLFADSSVELCPIGVIAALVTEFQRGMDTDQREWLARWFSGRALSLAADEAAHQQAVRGSHDA